MLSCKLRHLMADRRLDKPSDLARLTGLSRNPILKLYREQNTETVNLGSLIAICIALKCKLSDLIEYTPEEEGT